MTTSEYPLLYVFVFIARWTFYYILLQMNVIDTQRTPPRGPGLGFCFLYDILPEQHQTPWSYMFAKPESSSSLSHLRGAYNDILSNYTCLCQIILLRGHVAVSSQRRVICEVPAKLGGLECVFFSSHGQLTEINIGTTYVLQVYHFLHSTRRK
jgi:hypothetical protein